MGSESSPKLPIIDFNKLELGGQNPNKWEAVKCKVYKAFEDYGCFEALYDNKIPLDLRKSLFVALKELFDLPRQTKLRYSGQQPNNYLPLDQTKISSATKNLFLGYVGQEPNLPLHERLTINDPFVIENVESLEKTLWHEGNPSFRSHLNFWPNKKGLILILIYLFTSYITN